MSVDKPLERFEAVFRKAGELGIANPNAMLLGTVDERGRPSSRAVLLKQFDERGFVFYTNLESRKARQIQANPRVCLNFYWRELEQQIQIEGAAEPVSDAEADEYFATRDRRSQLGAYASRQSRQLTNRALLVARVAKYEAKFLGGPIPRPPFWSGLRVVPERYEFWVSGPFRLHERTVFEKTAEGWKSRLLYP